VVTPPVEKPVEIPPVIEKSIELVKKVIHNITDIIINDIQEFVTPGALPETGAK
jgi:hypothetical protein